MNTKSKLEKVFSRVFFEEIFDSKWNITGKFTNSEKTKFKIVRTIGIYKNGGTPPFHCEILEFGENQTKIVIRDESRILGTIIFLIFSLMLLPIVLIFTYFGKLSFLEFLAFLILFPLFPFLIIKFSKFSNDRLLKDLERILNEEFHN